MTHGMPLATYAMSRSGPLGLERTYEAFSVANILEPRIARRLSSNRSTTPETF